MRGRVRLRLPCRSRVMPGVWGHGCGSHISPCPSRASLDVGCGPIAQALLRSQAGPRAGAWLNVLPVTRASPGPRPPAFGLAASVYFPLTRRRCGGEGVPGRRAEVDRYGENAAACPRTGLQVVREAVGPLWHCLCV